jgi:hypothetical protein
MMNDFKKTIEKAKLACIEHGFYFVEVYETISVSNVDDGWDRFIISPVHVSEKEYRYIGYVKNNGEFIGIVPDDIVKAGV